jgi:hypothetical protein
MSPEAVTRQLDFLRSLNAELGIEITNMRASNVQREIRLRQFQLEEQARRTGGGQIAPEALIELQRAQDAIRTAAFANQFQGLRDSLLTQEQIEMESFARRTELLTGFLNVGLIKRQEFDALYLAEFTRTTAAMEAIQQANAQHQINAQNRTIGALGNMFQILGQKSKAAAVIALAINTALQARSAIQNTAAAATRALAELGPIAGPPAAAAIKAWGAAEVGLIIASGALAGAASLSAGGGPSAGGAASTPTRPIEEEGSAPVKLVIEGVDPAAIFTGKQLNDLIEKINEEAANGAIVVANRII